jgi:hypothetical protein
MPPQGGEPLYLYVAATTQVVSVVIVVERTEEGHGLPVQRLVYYISEVLSETKARYPQIQKLLYAVVLARRKLQHYFEAHPVTVVSSFPVVVAQSAHEVARRHGEAALVVSDEAADVAVRRVGLLIRRRRNNPHRRLPIHVRRQLAAVHKLAQGEPQSPSSDSTAADPAP